MTRLLMFDLDQRLIAAVTRALQQDDITVIGARSVAGALDLTARERFDAAILDCDVIEADDLSAFLAAPVILTTSFLTPEGEHPFFLRAPLLGKPFTSVQLWSALRGVCAGMKLRSDSLVDKLQRAHCAGDTLTLELGAARLFVERGELVHAECHGSVGELALAEILAVHARMPVALGAELASRHTIQRPFHELMLDLLRGLEERERDNGRHEEANAKTATDRGAQS